MADVITRLKVESSEYDSKIKRASEGILQLERTVRTAGESFLSTWKDEQKFVAALGNMETISKSARGKISELTSAFTDLSMVYKRMTDEEKASPFGKGLASSLDQLKARINEAKADLAEVNKELGNTSTTGQETGGMLDTLAGKFGISTKALMGWGAAIGAGKVALDVAKDAFFASEQNLDDWNRAVYASESAWQAFLTSLNTGDVGGFLQNIDSIVKAATDAYNSIDRLQTMQNIQTPQKSVKQAEVQRFETMLRTGRYIAPIDGRKTADGMKEGDVLTNAQKDAIAKNLASAMKEIAALTKNEVQASTRAINDLYTEQALRLGMSNEEFKKGTASMAAFEANLEKARKYQDIEAQRNAALAKANSGISLTSAESAAVTAANPYKQYQAWGIFKDDGELYQRIIQMIQQRDAAQSQYYGMAGRAYRGINRAEGVRVGGTGSTTTKTDQEKAQARYDQAQKDYNQALEEAALAVKSGQADTVAAKKKELSATESLWKAIGDAREIYDSDAFKTAQENAAKKVVELGGSVNALVEEQKKAQEAARKLTTAQDKAATAYQQMQTAQANNDLKAYNTALKQYQTAQDDVQRIQTENPNLPKKQTIEVEYIVTSDTMNVLDELKKIEGFHFDDKTMSVTFDTSEAMRQAEEIQGYKFEPKQVPVTVEQPKPVQVPVEMSYTDSNMSAFLASLKERIAQEDVGSTLYQNLTAQIADANALANLMQTAVKNGIDITQFNPQELWSKVFGKNPGDYITDEQLEEIRKKIEEIVGKPIKLDVNTGNVITQSNETKDALKEATSKLSTVSSGLSSVSSGLSQMGVSLPSAVTDALNFVGGLISVINGVTSIIEVFSTTTATAQISSQTANTAALGALTAAVAANTGALVTNSAMSIIPGFAHGGIIPHAANGYFVPGTHYSGDVTPIMANAGELVLSRAQQSNLASTLLQRDESGYGGTPYVSGEQIFLGLNNYLKRSGRGELITARG